MGNGTFLAEAQQDGRLRGMHTLVPAGQGEQSQVANSSLGVQRKVDRDGCRKACWDHWWRPFDALS